MNVKSGQTWTGLVVTRDSTGALAAPSVGPVGTLYVNGVSNGASVSVTGSNPYKWSVTLPTLTAGDTVSMYVTATITGVATAVVAEEASADTKRVSDLHDVATSDIPSAATIATSVRDVNNTSPAANSLGAAVNTAAGGTGGTLSLVYTLTQPPAGTGTPIDGATVELYSDLAMTHLVDQKVTNSFGVVTFTNLIAGTYYLKRVKDGYTFTNPDQETVSP